MLIGIVACAPPPALPPPVAPPPAEILKTFVFAPDGEPLRYGEPLPKSVTTPFDDAVIAATKTTPDPRLFRVCEILAAIHDHLDPRAVDLAWSWYGAIELPPRPIVIEGDDPQQALAALGMVPPGSHIGIGHYDRTVVFVVTTPHVVIAPFASSAPIEGGFAIDAKLEPSARDPLVQVEWDDESVQRSEPTLHGRAFQARVGCQNRPGHGRISIIGHVDNKTSVLARFSVWCGTPPPRRVTIDPLYHPGDDRDPDRAARRLFTLLQRDRVVVGLPQLTWDDNSATKALQHAEDTRTALAGTNPEFHRTRKIAAATIIENDVVASTVDEAYAKLMADSERRASAMSP
ncbi:MAG TPA: hypothetical protein VGO00_25825, partial [Kofleriaceae bacterium]|nr:hypothetical protein [Kofleriaceae bacterium]